MSVIPRSFPPLSVSKLALLTFAFAHVAFLSPSHAMQVEHHDKCMHEALQDHNFNYDHFIEQQGEIPLYDISQASPDRALQMHQENLKDFQMHQENLSVLQKSILLSASMTDNPSSSYWDLFYYPRCLLEVVGNNMPSLGWPSFSFFSTPTSPLSNPTPEENLNILNSDEPSYGFDLMGTSSIATTTLLESNSNTSQDWCTKGVGSSESDVEYLGLSLDGGGVRGLMIAMWVEILERKTNQPVNKIFDLIGGTSIGGMAALLLTASDDGKTPKMDGNQLANLIGHSERIFPQRNRYNLPARLWDGVESLFYTRYTAGPLEGLLKEYVGDLTLSSSLTRTLITAVNADTVSPRIFDSFSPIDKVCKVWEIGLCTSAAPTFFPAHCLSTDKQYYIDGGIAKNNPGLDVLKGLSEMPNFSFDKTAILSLGTGNMPLGKIPANAGVSSVGTIVDALIATQSKSVEITLGELLPKGYSRANPKFEESISLDQLDEKSLALLKAGAEREYGVIETFAESDLVQNKLERISKI